MKYTIIITAIISFFILSCNSQSTSDTTINKKTSIIEELEEPTKILPQEEAKYPYVKLIPTPKGYKRIEVEKGSFAEYLTNLSLKTENNKVYLYNGEMKYNQTAQFAVLKIDVGTRDLQQCADAVMRLRAEYLYEQKRYSDIHFNFISDGKPRYFNHYAKGNRSQKKFRKYMNYIFSYANTASLKSELKKVSSIQDIQIGDVFIQKGKPYGHAITVMNIAANKKEKKVFMLSQSFMPAQDIYILKNLNNEDLSPWYEINTSGELITPEWSFRYEDLMRF